MNFEPDLKQVEAAHQVVLIGLADRNSVSIDNTGVLFQRIDLVDLDDV